MVFHGMGHGQVGQDCFAAGLDDRCVVAPVDEIPQGRGADEDYYYGGKSNIRDKRLILVTDLGIIVKKDSSGGKDIFVQSILNGTPVSGATVEVI